VRARAGSELPSSVKWTDILDLSMRQMEDSFGVCVDDFDQLICYGGTAGEARANLEMALDDIWHGRDEEEDDDPEELEHWEMARDIMEVKLVESGQTGAKGIGT